ncbi:MAG TPA: Mur ligase family protein, partial [Candidatus Saccharimonadales bacterium]
NPVAWTLLFIRNERQLRQPAPYDVVVIELGTDGPGQVAAFKRYLKVDIAVVTSIAYEHMEFFANLDAVAKEELAVQRYSARILANADLCDEAYLRDIGVQIDTYAIDKPATYTVDNIVQSNDTLGFAVKKNGLKVLDHHMKGVARSQLYSAAAAVAVGELLGMDLDRIKIGVEAIEPVAGRMQQLKGIKDSLLLDETYNASPEATKAALDTLYMLQAPQKIALLGNMNELGDYSVDAHRDVGEYCDPERLDLLLTLGKHANEVLAPAARSRGCHVKTCKSPYEAGEYLRRHIKPRAVILVKGSQNGVFAEEAVKLILKHPEDSKRLVRQSKQWLAKKQKQFARSA